MAAQRKKKVVVFIRVSDESAEDEEMEKQSYAIKQILENYGLEQIHLAKLKMSGTVVAMTEAYKTAINIVQRPGCDGLVVADLARWFRLKRVLIGDWAKQLAAYVEPFEVPAADGKSAKLIYTTITSASGDQEFFGLDLHNPKDQDRLMEAINYYTRERQSIANRFDGGKESARLNPEICVDTLPNGVEFHPHPNQKLTDATGRKKTRIKGWFSYNEYALKVVKPILEKYDQGVPKFQLWKEYEPIAAQLVNDVTANGNYRKNGGLSDVNCIDHLLKNPWWIGIKHRKFKANRDFKEELNRFKTTRKKRTDQTCIEVQTNLAGWVNPDRQNDPDIPREPLISREMWDRIQSRLANHAEEYGRRKKLEGDQLLHPLFHCSKCGAIMYGVAEHTTGKNKRHATYICGRRKRFTVCGKKKGGKWNDGCDEPIYNQAEADRQFKEKVHLLLLQDSWVDARLEEYANDEHRATAEASAAAKERAVAQAEKELKNLVVELRKAKDETLRSLLSDELQDASRALANTKNELSVAQAELKQKPRLDKAAARQLIREDFWEFDTKSRPEQKAIISKYITRCVANPAKEDRIRFEVTGQINFVCDWRITAPEEGPIYDTDHEPVTIPPDDGTLRVKVGKETYVVDPKTKSRHFNRPHRSTSEKHCSASFIFATDQHDKK